MEKADLIKKYKNLFWYVNSSQVSKISDEVLVEFILNYGSWKAITDLLKTLGVNRVAEIFVVLLAKERSNLFPEIKHYFNLFFKKHAPQYFK